MTPPVPSVGNGENNTGDVELGGDVVNGDAGGDGATNDSNECTFDPCGGNGADDSGVGDDDADGVGAGNVSQHRGSIEDPAHTVMSIRCRRASTVGEQYIFNISPGSDW